jgi:hypothetical protein
LKDLIWFTDISLYNDCEVAARLHEMPKANDFIIFCCENFLKKSMGDKKLKKPLDMWLAMNEIRKTLSPEPGMAAFIEKICRTELYPAPEPKIEEAKAVVQPEPSKGIMEKVSDLMTLPRG